jgi:hypothetical protein
MDKCMNKASEAILRWYLLSLEDGDKHAEALIYAIAIGIENGDEKLRQMFYLLLSQAHAFAEESGDYEIISRLFELHFELDILKYAEIRGRNIAELVALANSEARGPISARIRDIKIKSLIDEIGLDDLPV